MILTLIFEYSLKLKIKNTNQLNSQKIRKINNMTKHLLWFNMHCWQINFKDKQLKDGFKQKNLVTDLDYDGYTSMPRSNHIMFNWSCRTISSLTGHVIVLEKVPVHMKWQYCIF